MAAAKDTERDKQLRSPSEMHSYVVGPAAIDDFYAHIAQQGQEVVGKFNTQDPVFKDYEKFMIGRTTLRMVVKVGFGATNPILPEIVSEH